LCVARRDRATRGRSLSGRFEHTVGVTEKGAEIFTLSPKGFDKLPYRV
jgi:methionyl aminopeptidase